MIKKLFRNVLVALLAALVISSCSGRPDAPAKEAGVTTVPETSASTTAASGDDVPVDEATIKAEYLPSEEKAAELAGENTPNPLVYSGFTCHFFETPRLADDLPIVSVTPLYSHAALHNYIEQNSSLYDLGEGEGSFEAFAESYIDSFFEDKGVLVISFSDKEGGGSYTLTGAWENHLEIDERHLDQLIMALKKTPGDITAGHLIVEMDSDFISLWDSISMSLYE